MKKIWASKPIIGLIGILFSLLLIYFIFKKIDFDSIIIQLAEIKLYNFLILSTVYLATFFLRAYRWKIMLLNFNVSFEDCLDGVVVGFAGNNFIPARGGELLRMEFFCKKTKINRITGLSSVFSEKIFDGFSLIIYMILGFSMIDEGLLEVGWVNNLFFGVCVIFGGIILFIMLFKKYYKDIAIYFEKKNGAFFLTLEKIILKISDAFSFIQFNLNTLTIFLLGLLIWLMESSLFIMGFYILDIQVDFLPVGLILLSIVNFGLLVPSSPGYVGVFQAMTILGLALFNISEEKALTLSILVHSVQFIPITIWGLLILFKSSISFFLFPNRK